MSALTKPERAQVRRMVKTLRAPRPWTSLVLDELRKGPATREELFAELCAPGHTKGRQAIYGAVWDLLKAGRIRERAEIPECGRRVVVRSVKALELAL